eukprot:CAMPEP_0206311756 /NCGR_PEP_ID=MMETSP0106_2-20121207/13630_1 /ASSEMBLY_ACC=CAM_ASM_000206 /TAXON_ID=81532 /ORGANISM="Acanthoeca-like sp., Strain 10tr" /LENGTH=404 /DNA_ID=CAMNT_0053743019 /DNA_START=38 /DNA_END=1252 /DNA_ORIENTATION=+
MAAAASRLSGRCVAEMSGGGVSVWSEIIALSKLPGITDLGQGWPDVPRSKVASEKAAAIVLDESAAGRKLNQYSPIAGSPNLCRAISDFHGRRYPGPPPDPASEVAVMTSGTEALFSACLAFCEPGDEVVLFEPFFPWYLPCVRLAGATPKVVTLEKPAFAIDERALRAAFSAKTKCVVVNSPHNPTGHVLSQAELDTIGRLCVEFDCLAIFDEVYETTLFGGAKHRRLGDVDGMRDRTVNIGSAGKIYNVTGWRIGWVTGPADLVGGCRTMHGYSTFSAPTPFQEGIAAALTSEPDTFFEGVSAQFAENFKLLGDAITEMGHRVCCADGDVGGYFLVADVAASRMDGLAFSKWLATEKGVACVPLMVFYEGRPKGVPFECTLVRFAICKPRETIELACKKLLA